MTNIEAMKLALDKVADIHRLLRQAISEASLGAYHGKLMREVCNKVINETLVKPSAISEATVKDSLTTQEQPAEQEPLPFCKLCNVKIPHKHISLDTIEYTAPPNVELEPVAWLVQYKDCHTFVWGSKPEYVVDGFVEPLYTAPPQREWVSPCRPWQDLTDDEIQRAIFSTAKKEGQNMGILYARAIEEKLKEKNK